MFLLDATALLLAAAALFGLANHRWFRLPFTIGLLLAGLLGSLAVLGIDVLVPHLQLATAVRQSVLQVDFAGTVLNGMLALLLFAGALHTDVGALRERATAILTLATVGTLISTLVAAVLAAACFAALGIPVAWPWCLAFGALISPTDPIAVLGIMKAAKAPPAIEAKVIGESMGNDGIGVLLFTIALGLANAGEMALPAIGGLLAQEVLGGLALGAAVGALTVRALRLVDEPNLEVLITFAAVFGIGFLAAPDRLHVSAPLAAVVAGLLIGSRGRRTAMSPRTTAALDIIWTFVDEALNAMLFLLIGIEFLAIDYSTSDYLLAAVLLIPGVLAARWCGVAIPLLGLGLARATALQPGTIPILTWGGLKGGISVALAMKLPEFPGRNAVLCATYAIVVFSIVVQGLTIAPLLRRLTSAGWPGSPP